MITLFRSRNPLGCVIAALIAGFSPIICLLLAFGVLTGQFSTRNLCETSSSVERMAGVTFPTSATHMEFGFWSGDSHAAIAYFDVKPSDLAVFVNSTHVKLPLSSTAKPDKLECYPCNNLSDLKSYLYGTYRAGARVEEIFIDTSNSELYRVYFTLIAD